MPITSKSELISPIFQKESGYDLDITIKNFDGTLKDLSTYTGFSLLVWDIDDEDIAVVDETMTQPSGSIARYNVVAGVFDSLATDGSKRYQYTVEHVKSGVFERTLPADFIVKQGGPT